MSSSDGLVANAKAYRESGAIDPGLAGRPALGVAVVACMDARIDVYSLLGLRPGDAHVIRNAGGLVTDDAVRSLAISQRALGTREIVLIHHTSCGMQGLDDEKLAAELEAETGQRPPWTAGGFDDPVEDVRRSIRLLRSNPFIPARDSIRGFVFDVKSGELEEVDAA